MEVSTQRKSSISSFRCYSQCQAGSSDGLQDVYDDSYTFRTSFMDCEDESPSMNPSIVSSLGCSEEDNDDSELTDDFSSGSGLRNKKKDCCLVLASSTEMLRIRFPFQSISIRLCDFLCLQENNLLNDTIVDFYLNHIVEHVLPDEPNKCVTVLPSVFWHNLSILHCGASVDDKCGTLTDEQKLDARFGDILDFVEDFDFIDVEYIVLPVNEWEHWSLVVICHPFTTSARMVCFDSQINEDLNNVQNIALLCNEFLKYVWLRRRPHPHCSVELMPCVIPERLPQQSNNFDCGLYIVEFARRFLLAPPHNLDAFDFCAEYPDFTVKSKRTDIQNAILSLCSNRELWNPIIKLLNKRVRKD